VAFAATGFACPPSADNFIYGFTPIELRRNIKVAILFTSNTFFATSILIFTNPGKIMLAVIVHI